MPTGAPVVWKLVHVMFVWGVAGCGENVIGASVPVRSGFAASFGSACAVVVTTPVKALFLYTVIETALLRFCVVPIGTEAGTAYEKSGIVMTVPE